MIKHRSFKISINILIFSYYSDSKVYEIKNNFTLVRLSVWHTLIALFLGWWGTGIFLLRPNDSLTNTAKAIHINLSGGEDYKQEMESTNYDDKTNYIWNNLLRETSVEISRNIIELLIEIQDGYEKSNCVLYTEDNISYINATLSKIEADAIPLDSLNDVFDAMKLYEDYISLEVLPDDEYKQYRF